MSKGRIPAWKKPPLVGDKNGAGRAWYYGAKVELPRPGSTPAKPRKARR